MDQAHIQHGDCATADARAARTRAGDAKARRRARARHPMRSGRRVRAIRWRVWGRRRVRAPWPVGRPLGGRLPAVPWAGRAVRRGACAEGSGREGEAEGEGWGWGEGLG
eukprot:7381946-Prymnesium_polylepis.1